MTKPVWTPEAEAAMGKVPFFVRGLAKKVVVKAALEQGVDTIDMAFVIKVRQDDKTRRGDTD